VGKTAAETKREIDQTREHLGQTLDAIQLRARQNLDLRRQLRTNHAVQASIGGLVLFGAGLVILWRLRRARRSPAELLARRLKLQELRRRLEEFRQDAGAWSTAQRRLRRSRNPSAKTQPNESAGRRIALRAAEAAVTALAAGAARRMMERSRIPHERAHPTAAAARKP